MTDYFGEPWPSGVCEMGTQRPTPSGTPCAWCKYPIEDGDQGVLIPFYGPDELTVLPWHKECFMRSTLPTDRPVVPLESLGPQTPAERRAEAIEVWDQMMAMYGPPTET